MRTLSITETRQNLSNVVQSIEEGDVVIQNRGQAEAVIIPYADYALLQQARERERIAQAVAQLEQLAAELAADFADMDEAEATDIGRELLRESVELLAAQNEVAFAERP